MPDPISWAHSWPYFAAAFVIAYLVGSIPFGLVLTRLAGLGDIRKVGSGNIGATNVLRTGRKGLAAATLALDAGKGAAAALLGAQYGPDIAVTASLAVVLGHLFPVWLRFRGGKAVATTLGMLLGLAWPVGIAACGMWAVVAALTRRSSLGGLASVAAGPVAAWFLATPQITELSALVAIIVWLRHHENIRRLLKGEEPVIGKSKPDDG